MGRMIFNHPLLLSVVLIAISAGCAESSRTSTQPSANTPTQPPTATGAITSVPTATPWPSITADLYDEGGQWITFASDRSGDLDIYVMNIENEETYRLTESHGSDWDPVWSPDGQSIVFVSDRDDNYEIYVMNTDGSGQTRLTNNDYEDWQPTWSPDGQRIAFSSYRYQYKHDIISINIDGSDLTVVSQNAMDNQWPAWSPDGEWIAFSVNGQESPWTPIYYDWDICIAHPDGSGFARLMDSPGPDWGPAWFPDSRQLIFTSERSGYYQMEFYTINWDGTGQTRFMPKTGLNFHPSWSPNGDYLIFTSDLAGNYDVYVINADGSGLRNLTSNQAKDLSGSWRP